MNKRPVKESATVKIGGVLVSKFSAYRGEFEVLLVVRSKESFFPIVFTGGRAYRADKISQGQWIEVKGRIVEHPWAADIGWKTPFSVSAENLRIGAGKENASDPLEGMSELSKSQIFKSCFEISKVSPFVQETQKGEIN